MNYLVSNLLLKKIKSKGGQNVGGRKIGSTNKITLSNLSDKVDNLSDNLDTITNNSNNLSKIVT